MKVMLNEYVPMRDGVRLAANIALPDGDGPFPTVLSRTPYGKGAFSLTEPHPHVCAGYAVVMQDCRGRFDSEGEWFPVIDEAPDGYDTIEWIAQQAWSDGRIGMVGGSYLGIVQWAAASACPPHLCCIVPQVTPCDHYENWMYRGGAAQIITHYPWAIYVQGRICQQMPKDELLELFHTLPLSQADRAAGRDIGFWQEWMTHSRYDAFWEPQNFETALDRITVPALNLGGWYDMYSQPALRCFAGQRERGGSPPARNGARAIIGPWTHGKSGTCYGDLDFGPQSDLDLDAHALRFLNRWLKDADDGLDAEPPLWLFVMGRNEWRREHEWPLPETEWRRAYLHSRGGANAVTGDGVLSFEQPADEPPDRFDYDPLDPVPTRGGNHSGDFAGTLAGPVDQRPVEQRPDVLVYATKPLEHDLDVIGPVRLHLAASSSAPDTDFTGKLVDVHPDGQAIIISDGILRASHRESSREPSPIQPGQLYEFDINLGTTANCFRQGHRVRLEVSSSNFPRYSRNLNTGLDSNHTAQVATAHQTVYHQRGRESWLELPVVGPSPR